MGTLIRKISSFAAIGYGINIWEQDPPAGVRAVGTRTVGVVADLPWGPQNTITDCSSPAELLATFAPGVFSPAQLDDYDALKAFINKRFPRLKVLRIAATDAVAASKDYDGVGPADSITCTAAYKGALGNQIAVAWAVNADDATARDATVTIGTRYSVTYEAVATIVGGNLVVTDPGDPYVTFAKNGAGNIVPAAAAAVALASGSDGTAVAADYVGSGSSDVGIRKFYGDAVDVNVLFVAECPTALADAVNTGLEAYANDVEKGITVLCSVPSQAYATALTYAADYRVDRVAFAYPRVKTTNTFDADLAEVEVDGNAFMAAVIANVDPEVSPGGAASASYLTGITGLENESLTTAQYDALNAAGIAPFMMSTALGGAIIRRGVTTSLTSGRTRIARRRMTDFITLSIAGLAEAFAERPLDIDLANQNLGPYSNGLISGIQAFLDGLLTAPTGPRIVGYTLDPFGQNVQADIDAGRWYIAIRVKLLSSMDEIVLLMTAGEAVQLLEAA